MGSIVTTSNSRPIYNENRTPDWNAKPGSPAYYGLTKEQYDEWRERAEKIANSDSFDDLPKYDVKIIFEGTDVIW